MSTAKECKDQGNALVKEKKYKEALECYSKAISFDPNDHILYSNRSLMHLNLGEFQPALEDAEKAISIKPDYSKGYLRKGKALHGLGKDKEAVETYKLGLEKEPENAQLKEAVAEIETYMNNPFLKNYGKLYTDPRTAPLMKDPQFKNILDYAMRDQKVLLQMVQTDPRFMDVFSVLTGIDMGKMNEEAQKAEEKREEERKKKEKEEAEKKKKEEEERKKKLNLFNKQKEEEKKRNAEKKRLWLEEKRRLEEEEKRKEEIEQQKKRERLKIEQNKRISNQLHVFILDLLYYL